MADKNQAKSVNLSQEKLAEHADNSKMKIVNNPPLSSKIPTENDYVEDEEDVEYEEYEEEVDEESVDDEFEKSGPMKMVQQSPMADSKTNPIMNEDDGEDEEYEEEEEEVDEEYDEEEYNQVANKIDELLNKTNNLKAESKQNQTEIVDKLSNLEVKQSQPKQSSVTDLAKSDFDFSNEQNESNLSKMRHASNKWNISELNEDETIPYDSGKTALDSDESELDSNYSEMPRNPIIREKLRIQDELKKSKKLATNKEHFGEDEKEIDEIEVALEENFIEELDESEMDNENVNELENLARPVSLNPFYKKNISNDKSESDGNEHKGTEVKFAKDFVENIIADVASSSSSTTTTTTATAASATNPIILENTGADPVPLANIGRVELDTEDGIVKEFLLTPTDLSKKYSFDLSNSAGCNIGQKIECSGIGARSNLNNTAANNNVPAPENDGFWGRFLKHLFLTFIFYLAYKMVNYLL